MFTPAAGFNGRGPRWLRGSSEAVMLVQAREGGARIQDVAYVTSGRGGREIRLPGPHPSLQGPAGGEGAAGRVK